MEVLICIFIVYAHEVLQIKCPHRTTEYAIYFDDWRGEKKSHLFLMNEIWPF